MPADDCPCSDLTERQATVWRAMRHLQSRNGGLPASRAEIGTMLAVTPTGAASHFPALERKGYLEPVTRYGRLLWLAVVPDGTTAPVAPTEDAPLSCLPLLGGPQPEDGWTPRQIQVWRTLLELQERDGFPPTQETLSRALGLRTVQGVRTHFAKLEAAGYLAHRRRLWLALRKEDSCASLPSTQTTAAEPSSLPLDTATDHD